VFGKLQAGERIAIGEKYAGLHAVVSAPLPRQWSTGSIFSIRSVLVGISNCSAFQPERTTADKPIRILRATFSELTLAYSRSGQRHPPSHL
jgi:hypothetical protein